MLASVLRFFAVLVVAVVITPFVLSQGAVQRPTVAVVPLQVASNVEDSNLGSKVAAEITRALSLSKRFTVLEREQLLALLKEDSLMRAGVTNIQASAAGKKLGANYVVVGVVSAGGDGQSFDVQTRVVSVSDGVVVANPSLFGVTKDRLQNAANDWLLRYSAETPMQTTITAIAGNTAEIPLGSDQGLSGALHRTGAIYRANRGNQQVGTLELRDENIGLNSSRVRVIAHAGMAVQKGDVVRLGGLVLLSSVAQRVWNTTPPAVTRVGVEHRGKSIEPLERIRLGEKIVVSVVSPISGYMYILSVYPNERQFNVLAPFQNQATYIRAGETFVFPAQNDSIELIAQEPTGLTWLRAYVFPNRIADLEGRNQMALSDEGLRGLQNTIAKGGANWASGFVVLDVVP